MRTSNMLAVLKEKDVLNAQHCAKTKQPVRSTERKEINAALFKDEDPHEFLSDEVSGKKSKSQMDYLNSVNKLRAESIVMRSRLEIYLIKIAIKMIANEHTSLINCFSGITLDGLV